MTAEEGKYYWVLRNEKSEEWEPARADISFPSKPKDKLYFKYTDSSEQSVDNVLDYKEMKVPCKHDFKRERSKGYPYRPIRCTKCKEEL